MKIYKTDIAISLIIIFLIFIGYFLFTIKETEDFGLNFLTEMIGVAITILILDRLLKYKERKKNEPIRIIQYSEISLFLHRYIGLWHQLYINSVPNKEAKNIEDFLSKTEFDKIFTNAYLDSNANITPSTKLGDYILHQSTIFENSGNEILNRYKNDLPPIVFGNIHFIINTPTHSMIKLFKAIELSDKQYHFNRLRILGNYTTKFDNDFFNNFKQLVKWSNNEYNVFKRKNKSLIYPFEFDFNYNKLDNLVYKIPDEVVNDFIKLKNS